MANVKPAPAPEGETEEVGDGVSGSPSPSPRGPGSQRDYFQRVSGAGDGLDLQTSAGEMDAALPAEKLLRNGSAEPKTVEAAAFDPTWTKKVRQLNEEIASALNSVRGKEVSVQVGRRAIYDDQPVVLDWKAEKRRRRGDRTETGVALYLVVRLKRAADGVADSDIAGKKQFFIGNESDVEEGGEDKGSRGKAKKRPERKRRNRRRTKTKTSDGSGEEWSEDASYSDETSYDDDYDDYDDDGKRGEGKKSVRWRKEVDKRFAEDGEGRELDLDDDDYYEEEEELLLTDDEGGRRFRRRRRGREDDEELSPRYHEKGARSRHLNVDREKTASRRKTPAAGELKLGGERRLPLNLTDSPRSQHKEKLLQKRRKELKRRRRRQTHLKTEESFGKDGDWPEVDDEHHRSRSLDVIKGRRSRSQELSTEGDDDDDLGEFCRDGDHRHDTCFLPFHGYGELYDGPVGFLTSKLPDGSSTADHDTIISRSRQQQAASLKLPSLDPLQNQPESSEKDQDDGKCQLWRPPQLPNRIRRLRARHAPVGDKLWFTPSNGCSFNSRCASTSRFDMTDLDENARQYYFYKSLPRIASSPLISSTFTYESTPVSIFLGEKEPPSTPPAKRAAEERKKAKEIMLL